MVRLRKALNALRTACSVTDSGDITRLADAHHVVDALDHRLDRRDERDQPVHQVVNPAQRGLEVVQAAVEAADCGIQAGERIVEIRQGVAQAAPTRLRVAPR